MYKLISVVKAIIFLIIIQSNFYLPAQSEKVEYQRIYLSGKDASSAVEWDFKITEGRKSNEWYKIPVPSNWELHGFGNYNYGHDHENKERTLGKEHGLYQHKFSAPPEWKDQIIKIVFDGVMTDAEVKVNGIVAGELHQGAFYRFEYDITKLIKFGKENLLEVDVAKHSANTSVNKAEREADYWIFGGIYRPVFLEVLPQNHFTRLAIDAKHNGAFRALVKLNKPKSGLKARVKISNSDDVVIGNPIEMLFDKKSDELMLSSSFDGIDSWNPEFPSLYTATFELLDKEGVIFRKEEKFGFRTVELREKDGFYVNGERVIFKGVNRHSFWPETGRALSEENHLQDIMLMKEMNMNAVRMAHYSPDERFLDLCDSLGLFVLDELAGWQDGYDTIIGAKLVRELILDDANHPSVVIWDNGNEGGWEFATEKWFHYYDIQNRPVIYPWLKRNGVDTRHYPDYSFAIDRLVYGDEVFMPTEFLHGLYDGGHGASLDDFWSSYEVHPMFAGGFLWSFTDEAVVRTDQNNKLDSDGNHAPDGILGPYREKEGSFYTIKDVWSPIQIKPKSIRANFNGALSVTNKYLYTNINQCSFLWNLISVEQFGDEAILASGQQAGPDILPGETRKMILAVPEDLSDGEIFEVKAIGKDGNIVNTWRWPIKQPQEISVSLVSVPDSEVLIAEENENSIMVVADNMIFGFNKENGMLTRVETDGKQISLKNGPIPVGMSSELKNVQWSITQAGDFSLVVNYNAYPEKVEWKVDRSGLLGLEVSPLMMHKDSINMIGVSFDYPEQNVKSIKWMGQGPYRVWKNRTRGANLGVWEKDYNNTVTGVSFESLVYPEFKGYHGNMYWAELQTTEQPIRIIFETPGLYLGLFQPENPPTNPPAGEVIPPFPEGNLSFLYEIPAIGTKFKKVHEVGPSGILGQSVFRPGDQNYPIKLWFDFRTSNDEKP